MLEGIYYKDEQFFRFYKDGTFLDCLVKDGGEMKLVANWLKKEKVLNGVIKGRFNSNDKTISFSTPGHFANGKMIDYVGKIEGSKTIIFESLDHNTGRKTKNERFTRL